MKKLFVLLLTSVLNVYVYSQTGDDYFKKGNDAFTNESYQEAEVFLKKAAELGHIDACGLLSYMYYYGAINGKRDGDMALLWAKRAGVNNNLDADIVLALTSYFNGDFDNTIKILNYWKEEVLYSQAKIALAISYMMNGSEPIRVLGKQKAEPLVKSVYKKYVNERERSEVFFSACAILAKIEFEKKWDWTNNVNKYIEEFGKIGADDYEYCPLSLYVFGRYFYNIVESKKISKECIEIASKYVYANNKYELLFPFADEIKQEYNKIK